MFDIIGLRVILYLNKQTIVIKSFSLSVRVSLSLLISYLMLASAVSATPQMRTDRGLTLQHTAVPSLTVRVHG